MKHLGRGSYRRSTLARQGLRIRLTDTLLAANRRGYAALADSNDLRDHAKRYTNLGDGSAGDDSAYPAASLVTAPARKAWEKVAAEPSAGITSRPSSPPLSDAQATASVPGMSTGRRPRTPDPCHLPHLPRREPGAGLVGYSLRRLADVELGEHVWNAQQVSVMDLDELQQMLHLEFDGLLGQDILRQFRSVRIDYRAHLIDLQE